MDGKLKAGHVTLKAGVMRTKQKKWCVFYNRSDDDQHLEFYDSPEEEKKHKKSYQLKQVKSIDTVNKSSSKDYYIDIHMKKERLTLCFECETDLEAWSTMLHNYIPIISSDGVSGANMADEDEDGTTFKRNMLYESSEDTIAFDVMIEPTPASDKKHLDPDKPYRLLVTMTNIALEDPSQDENPLLFRWMFEFIRSYGTAKTTGLFTISSGRRSETGEGEFSFKVANPKAVDQAIDLQTQRKFNLKMQHSRGNDSETGSESLRSSASSKRPLSSPVGKADNTEAVSRSSLKGAGKAEKFQKELSASIASRQSSDKQKSSKKTEEKEKDKKDEKDKKEDKKGGFHLFGKKKDKKVKEQESVESKSSPKQQRQKFDDHIYDEAVPQIQPILSSGGDVDVYSEVQKNPGNWKTHGQRSSEIHVENYGSLLAAAKENKGNKMDPPLKNDDEDLYDMLDPKGGEKPRSEPPEEGLYGNTSGRPLQGIQPSSELDDETYDDVASFQSKPHVQIQYEDEACEYETVDIP
ncbi:uncharacterized protein LOC117339188 [Pecten maximus]|uniref:uncharacterized protein LOC117339188 n=1 Tax=Pecten maximus TaxID=6579 RepID=UPI0014590029|nr:uncharacterized protein LOC117339188 [Pecten maximus]